MSCCDGVEVVRQRRLRAAGARSCADCDDPIARGDHYWLVGLVVDGNAVAAMWCECCHESLAVLWAAGCRPRPGQLEAAWERAWRRR